MTPAEKISGLPSLSETIAGYNLRAEKKLGQNFILDLNVTDKIARSAGELSGHTVIEIGPGPGGLTRSLLKAGARKVVALEYDPRAVAALAGLSAAAEGRLEIVQADALKTDLLEAVPGGPRMIVANLPYNIATSLLIGWLEQVRKNPSTYDKMILMFQREVAERMIAAPGTRAYGRLSVIVQWLCSVKKLFDLPPSVFVPPPKVVSSVIEFTPRRLPEKSPPFDSVGAVTAAAFGQRRKMIRSSLKEFPGLAASCGIDETKRAEELAVSDFIALATKLSGL